MVLFMFLIIFYLSVSHFLNPRDVYLSHIVRKIQLRRNGRMLKSSTSFRLALLFSASLSASLTPTFSFFLSRFLFSSSHWYLSLLKKTSWLKVRFVTFPLSCQSSPLFNVCQCLSAAVHKAWSDHTLLALWRELGGA